MGRKKERRNVQANEGRWRMEVREGGRRVGRERMNEGMREVKREGGSA